MLAVWFAYPFFSQGGHFVGRVDNQVVFLGHFDYSVIGSGLNTYVFLYTISILLFPR